MTGSINLVIPYTPAELAPQTAALGRKLNARLVDVGGSVTAYWDLLEELWSGNRDFVTWEHDILPAEETVLGMAVCAEAWCSGTFGRWWIEPSLADWSPASPLPRGRRRRQRVLRSDSQLGLVKWGSIRQQVPDLFRRAEAHSAALFLGAAPGSADALLPPHHYDHLVPEVLLRVLHEEEGLSPHVHFPAILAHLKIIPGSGPPLPYRHVGDDGLEVIDPAWDRTRYESDLAEIDRR